MSQCRKLRSDGPWAIVKRIGSWLWFCNVVYVVRVFTLSLSMLLMSPSVVAAPSREPIALGSEGATLKYTVLGDSTAAGVGAQYDAGIAMSTARALARTRRVTLTNFAISGARMRDVLEDQLSSAEAAQPDVVLLSVGANDVTHLTPVRSVRRDLQTIIRRLRVANPRMRIVLTGSPDMGSPPRIPRLLRGMASYQTARINRMMMDVASAEGLTFAPIAEVTGPMFRRDRSLFDTDRFHPNERGYGTWVPVLNRALAAALGDNSSRD